MVPFVFNMKVTHTPRYMPTAGRKRCDSGDDTDDETTAVAPGKVAPGACVP